MVNTVSISKKGYLLQWQGRDRAGTPGDILPLSWTLVGCKQADANPRPGRPRGVTPSIQQNIHNPRHREGETGRESLFARFYKSLVETF